MLGKMIEDYYKVEEGYDTLIDDNGFCAYKYDTKYKNFYIGHVFMPVEKRKESEAFYNKVRFRAKALGAERIIGDLHLNVSNKDKYSRKVTTFLFNGFDIIDVNDKVITVMKEI